MSGYLLQDRTLISKKNEAIPYLDEIDKNIILSILLLKSVLLGNVGS